MKKSLKKTAVKKAGKSVAKTLAAKAKETMKKLSTTSYAS